MQRRPDWHRWLLAALISTVPLQVLAFDLADLMSLLAQRRSGEARFSEERHVQGIAQPLTSNGLLSFAAPDRFTRTTLQPRRESMAVAGPFVTVERNGRSREFALDAVPELNAIVTAVRGTLTGNADALRQAFEPAVNGSATAWTLTLVPREQSLQAVIKQMRIEGRSSDMRRVEVLLADGDRSVMTIVPTDATAARTTPP